jgi:hypothetical protein
MEDYQSRVGNLNAALDRAAGQWFAVVEPEQVFPEFFAIGLGLDLIKPASGNPGAVHYYASLGITVQRVKIVGAGWLSGQDLRLVRAWVLLNEDALLGYLLGCVDN